MNSVALPTPDEQFIAAAVRRMYRWMAVLAVVSIVALLAWKGWRHGGGFALGAALSALNFHWMKGAIDKLGEATLGEAALGGASAGSPARRGRVVVKFILRYALIIAAGYVIFRSSLLSLPAFLGGLFVFVAGVLAEMMYQLFAGTGNPGTSIE